jgi:hypothetical protein
MNDTTKTESNSSDNAGKIFSETAIEAALAKAGPLAQKRFLKKVGKIKYRAARWVAKPPTEIISPRPEKDPGGYVQKQRLPCKDVQRYIENFILTFAPEFKEKMYE